MGKATKDLAKPAAAGGALEKAAIGGALVEGRDAKMAISRVALYQGTAEEEQMYGPSFKRGDFIETLEKRNLGPSIEIVCIAGWVSWAKFVQGQKMPEYSTRNKAEVPAEDLVWNDDEPPAANETVNMVVLVNGEPFPSLFVFKRTGLKAYQRTIEPCEARFGRCVYVLSSEKDQNASKQPYQRLTATMKRKLTTEDPLLGVVKAVDDEFRKSQAKFEAAASEHGAAGSDIPV
jgi:hypothetical protein